MKSRPGYDFSELQRSISSIIPFLSEIPCRRLLLLFKQQVNKIQRIVTLKDLTRLLDLVTEQEKKYEDRMSPHINLYRQHLMVQQFL